MAEPDPRSGLAVASVRTFIAHAILWNIGLIGLMRWPGVADHVIGALISFQTSLVFWYGATTLNVFRLSSHWSTWMQR